MTSTGTGFIYCDGIEEVTIPSSITTISKDAFYGCTSLKTVNLPDNLTAIEDRAFCDCSGLVSISIPDSVTSIGGVAFGGCSSLESFRFPNTIRIVENKVLSNCSSLKSVFVPKTVERIEYQAFLNCGAITDFYVGAYHTVTFDLNGGSGTIDPQLIPDWQLVDLPADPEREGYSFHSWYTEGKLKGLSEDFLAWNDWFAEDPKNGYRVTKDETLHAGWLSDKLVYGKDTLNFENVESDFFRPSESSSGPSVSAEFPGFFEGAVSYPIRWEFFDFLFESDGTDSTASGSREDYNSLIYTTTPGALDHLTPAQKRLISMLCNSWVGSCFGMSSVIALVMADKLHVDYFQKNAQNTYDLSKPKDDGTVRSLINYYALMQKTDITSSRENQYSTEKDCLEALIGALDVNSKQHSEYPVIVEFRIYDHTDEKELGHTEGMSDFSAHAVLAYDFTSDPDTGDYLVSIWDPATKTAPASCDIFSVLRIKSDFSDAVFENFEAGSVFYRGHIRKSGRDYWRETVVKSIVTVESGLYDSPKLNLETRLKNKGYVHAYDGSPTAAQTARAADSNDLSAHSLARNNDDSDYVLYTNYPSFTITRSDGASAVVTNGYAKGSLSISDAAVLNDIETERLLAYSLPGLSAGQSYQIVPEQADSVLTGRPLNDYHTVLVDDGYSNDGFFASVDIEKTGTITFFDDAATMTSFQSPTRQLIDVVQNDAGTPWDSIAAAATSAGMTVVPSGNDTRISAVDNVPVTINIGDIYDRVTFDPVYVDSDGVHVKEADDARGAAVIVKDGEELGRKAMTQASDPPSVSDWNNPFADVAEGAWYYNAVKFVNQQGMMNGTAANLFSPDSSLTRAMLAQVLYNKEGRPSVTSEIPYTDVAAGSWYADAITWAASKGIIAGYGNGEVGPDDFITREQFAAILWRYSGSLASAYELQFIDAGQVSDYAVSAMKWAAENGIINGYGDNRILPGDNAARAHVAQMLLNYFGK